MTADEIKRLREIAEKATPGPWVGVPTGILKGARWVVANVPLEDGSIMLDCDARYIAAFDPSTALSLLDHLAALEAENAKLRAVAEKARAALRQAGMCQRANIERGDSECRNHALLTDAALAALESAAGKSTPPEADRKEVGG